jgi:hypothetical protein
MSFGDSQSESSIGFYKMVEAHGVGGMGPVSASTMVDWVPQRRCAQEPDRGWNGLGFERRQQRHADM